MCSVCLNMISTAVHHRDKSSANVNAPRSIAFHSCTFVIVATLNTLVWFSHGYLDSCCKSSLLCEIYDEATSASYKLSTCRQLH